MSHQPYPRRLSEDEIRRFKATPKPDVIEAEKAALLHTLHVVINAVTQDRAAAADTHMDVAQMELQRWRAALSGHDGAAG